MRPLKLELEGFTVYRQPQIIDFEPLNFFIIQGKTGAGKTSIVDAITYALYGKVPRYGSSKAHRAVLSKGASKLKVALDFSVEGRRYRIERFFRTKPEESSVRVYEENKRLNLTGAAVEEWVEKITGLNYRTFIRVILLPQGEFSRFLKPSSPKERREILMELMNLEIFEKLRQIASEQFKSLEGELTALKRSYDEIKEINEEKKIELKKEIEELKRKLISLGKQKKSLESLLHKAQERDKKEEEKIKFLNRLKDLESQQEEIQKLEEKIKLSRDIAPYIPYLHHLEEIEDELKLHLTDIEKTSKNINEVKNKLKEIENELLRVEKEISEIPYIKENIKSKLSELEKLKLAEKEFISMEILKEKVRTKRENLKKAVYELENIKQRILKGETLIKETEEEIISIDYDEEEYVDTIRLVERRKNLVEKKERIKHIERESNLLKKEKEKFLKELKTLQEKEKLIKEQSFRFYVRSIRDQLKEGNPCPVCGNPYKQIEDEEEEELISVSEEEREKISKEIINCERKISHINAQISTLEEEKRRIKCFLETEEIPEDIENKLRILEEKRRKKKNLEERLKKYKEGYEKLLKKRENILQQKLKLEAEIKSLEETLFQKEEYIRTLTDEVKNINDLKQKYTCIESEVRELEKYISLLEEKKEKLKTGKEKLKTELTALEVGYEELKKRLNLLEKNRKNTLKKLDPIFNIVDDLSTIKELFLEKEELVYLEDKVNSFRRELETVKERLREMEKEVHTYSNVPPTVELTRQLGELESFIESLQKQLGEKEAELKYVENVINRREEIVSRIKELESTLSIYGKIKEDLKSDRLQDFVSSLMLKRITDRASYYLSSIVENYELVLNSAGDLVIVDRVQGTERDVKSLSGGETFLASLSLALGISDVLSAKLESLFIDEGFGSLDEETRERVSDILELVRQRINRMIGIISHLPDLAERFHQRIVVSKHGNFSTVKVFY